MKLRQIIIDTNVFIASLRSQYGASYKLFMLLGSGKYEVNFSVPLLLEYEEVGKRLIGEIALTVHDINNILDYICSISNNRKVFYLWRPFLNDADDDMILELAISSVCQMRCYCNIQ